MIVQELSVAECKDVVSGSRLARIACSKDGQPYLVPIHYAFAPGFLYSFSMPGQKIDWMRENPKVCAQIDAFGEVGEWRSVIAYGVYEELPDKIGWKSRPYCTLPRTPLLPDSHSGREHHASEKRGNSKSLATIRWVLAIASAGVAFRGAPHIWFTFTAKEPARYFNQMRTERLPFSVSLHAAI